MQVGEMQLPRDQHQSSGDNQPTDISPKLESGEPYNNNHGDVSARISLIPRHPSSIGQPNNSITA